MACSVVVRRATEADAAARAELVRAGYTEYDTDAFLMFFFQETTLQGMVLGGAVAFIFLGCGWLGAALVLPAAALLVTLLTRATHAATAHTHASSLHKEMLGYVAELRGPLVGDARALRPNIVMVEDFSSEYSSDKPTHKQIVGTVSLSECWGPGYCGWLHDLVVHPRCRRRGVGRALVRAAREGAGAARLSCLRARTSELQYSARHLLHDTGWECEGSYHRPLLGALLTLHMAQLCLHLPLHSPSTTCVLQLASLAAPSDSSYIKRP